MASRPIHIMLVGAHPADCFDTAGGTLAHHVAQGDQVTLVVATTGVRSHHLKLYDEKRKGGAAFDVEEHMKQAIAEKLEELRSATRILGLEDVRSLGFDDDDMLVNQDKIDAIADMIREVQPDILITHHPFEMGGLKMHGTIGQATVFAWELAAGLGRSGQMPHQVAAVYFMCPMAYMGNNSLEYAAMSRADLYIDITDVIEKKIRAMDHISSQYYGGAYARKCAEYSEGAWGQNAGVAYAEQFQRLMPMVRYTIPITDAELDHITQTEESVLGRRSEMNGGLLPLPPNMGFTSRFRVPREKYQG